MNRLIITLLIPFFVLGQALPHSHAGSGVEQPSDHDTRPHVHWSGDHSHEHQHVEPSHHHDGEADCSESVDAVGFSISCPPIGHDADAIYLAAFASLVSRVVVATGQVDVASDLVIMDCLIERAVRLKPCGRIAPRERYTGVPIYLLVACLRI